MDTAAPATTGDTPVEQRLGTFSVSGGWYDKETDTIFMTVDAVDIQVGDRLSFHRSFFEHPTLFGESGPVVIAKAINEGFDRLAKQLRTENATSAANNNRVSELLTKIHKTLEKRGRKG